MKKMMALLGMLVLGCAAITAQESPVSMTAAEYTAYTEANNQSTPAAKAKAFQAYLFAYPNSSVKLDVLTQIVDLYSQTTDEASTRVAVENLLLVDPGNIRGLTLKVYYLRTDGDKATDPAVRLLDLDKAAAYAQQVLNAPVPKGVKPADFKAFKAAQLPIFDSEMAEDDLAKKDNADAIKLLHEELNAVPVAATEDPQQQLQDVYTLAQAYYTSTPPDLLNCAWYATRAGNFAQDPYKTQILELAGYCYKRFHGGDDGYAAMQDAVKTNLNPPAGYLAGIKPAPTPAELVRQLIATTPDLEALAMSDREYALENGSELDPKTQKSYADEVFDAVKGKAVELPDLPVITATASVVQVAVSDDAMQNKTADFTFNMKEPLAVVPAPGSKISLYGVFASYKASPLMVTMSDATVMEKKKPEPVVHRPVHKTTH
jgi:hypothetical protein